MSDRQFLNYIDGAWVPGSGTKPVPDVNPADVREVIGHATDSLASDVDAAVDAGKRAFAAWRATPAPQRGRICREAARLFEERKEEIGRVVTMEEGKILAEAEGEVLKGATLVEWGVRVARFEPSGRR